MIKKIVWNIHKVILNSNVKLSSIIKYDKSNVTTRQTNQNIEEVSQRKGVIQMKEKSSRLKTISNEGKRIEFQIMTKIEAPSFIAEYIETAEYAQKIKSFNTHLTNGGDQYQEFPLIKLLTIALRKVQEGSGDIASWKKLEYFIRKRLHRCTIEENLKLLYVMLKIFPKYTFDYSFILSICLALKKQIDIMSIDELKSLYYVLYTNSNQQKRYSNQILSNLQQIILSKMIARYRDKLRLQQAKNHIHLPLNNIYSWISLGLCLNLKNDYDQLVYQNKIVELIEHFNLRWEAAFAKQQYNRSISDREMASLLVLFCMNDNLVKYYEADMRKSRSEGSKDFKNIFNGFKLNFLVANSRSVQRVLKNCSFLEGIRAFRAILQMYSFQIIQNLLEQISDSPHDNTTQFPKIRNTLYFYMKNSQTSDKIISQKLKILTILFNQSVISLFELQAFYQSIDLSKQTNFSLDICNQLIFIELLIYSTSEPKQYQTKMAVLKYIFAFLEGHNFTYRNFDWNSFHFINIVLNQSEAFEKCQLNSNLPQMIDQKNVKSQISLRASKLLKKISEQVKISNTQKLVNQQKQIFEKKKQIKEIQKFFIQIRVNEMQKLQTIIAPFNRLPHFSNIKEKIAINALSSKELQLQSYKLQKKLLNSIGWKVINLNTAEFLYLSINQRLNFIADCLETQGKQIKRIGGKEQVILYEK